MDEHDKRRGVVAEDSPIPMKDRHMLAVLETRNYLAITGSWMVRTAESLVRIGTDEAKRHARELRGAAAMAERWVEELQREETEG